MPYKDQDKRRACNRRWYARNKDQMKAWAATPEVKERRRVLSSEYYHRHRDRIKAELATPEGKRKTKDRRLRFEYGLSIEEYEAIARDQKELCALCGRDNYGKPLVVDHDHQTGRIRGLLCKRCNTHLGLWGDTTADIERVLGYMKGKQVWTQIA